GARYSTVRRADSTRDGSTGAEGELGLLSGRPTPGPRSGGSGAPESFCALATCARLSTAAFSTQPARSTWTQLPDVPSATLLSRNSCGSLAIRAPAGAEHRFSLAARLRARSYSARGVGPAEVANIQPSSVIACYVS